jgi:HK97 family phage major capsid protein
MVRDDTVGAMALREDQAFLRDDGSAHTPKGLRYQVSTASPDHVIASAGKTIADTTTDYSKAILAMRNAYVRFLKPAFFMSYRSKLFLQFLRDTNSNFVYPEIAQGNWGGIPLFATTTIPDNLGGGSNESEIYLVDLADMIIGEGSSMEVQAFDGAAYHDGSAVQSGVSLDQTILRVLTHHDFGVRHNQSIYVLTGVLYGT